MYIIAKCRGCVEIIRDDGNQFGCNILRSVKTLEKDKFHTLKPLRAALSEEIKIFLEILLMQSTLGMVGTNAYLIQNLALKLVTQSPDISLERFTDVKRSFSFFFERDNAPVVSLSRNKTCIKKKSPPPAGR